MSTDAYESGAATAATLQDRERLDALAMLWDEGSQALIDRLGIRPKWRCLELGAGTGSLAHWLSYRCPRGHVTATDIDLRFLTGQNLAARPNVQVLMHDAVDGPDFVADSFDLIHSRAVLTHIPDRHQVLTRATAWLAPGGWILLEEPTLFPAATSPHPALRRLQAAYTAIMGSWLGSDLDWARRLPTELQDLGLEPCGMNVRVMVIGDGGPGDAFWRTALEQVGPFMTAESLLTTEELDDITHFLDEPGCLDMSFALVSTWARKQ